MVVSRVLAVRLYQTTKSSSIATSSAKRAIASMKAKYMKPEPFTASAIEGLRPMTVMMLPKRWPRPRPTPRSGITARPAPMYFAAWGSMFSFLFFGCCSLVWLILLVQFDRVLQVHAGQDGENIGLDEGDHQLEADEGHVDDERQDAEHRARGDRGKHD